MIKFIVHTKSIPKIHSGDVPAIVEVSGQIVSPMDDPSVIWLPRAEFRFRIESPAFLYEPQEIKSEDGSKKKVLMPPVYHSHAVYSTLEEARAICTALIKEEFEFKLRKNKITSYTQEELEAKISQINIILL